jgi:sulfite dehydrogenase
MIRRTPPLTRRHLLGAGATLAGGTLLGCASPGGTPISRVVIIGGGYGGATAAHYLKRWGGAIDVTLVEREAAFVSCPLSNLVVGGHRTMADITRGYGGLAALGVRVVRGDAVAVDSGARSVRLADGRRLPYDRLIVAPGIGFITGGIPGLQAALDAGRVAHAWKAGPQTALLRRQLEAMPDGGVFALSIPPAPYRCPPGPYERACMVASYLKAARPRSKVIVFDANPDIQSKKALFLKAWAEHYPGLIDYRPNSILRELQADGTAVFDFEEIRPAVLNVIPPNRAGDIARQAGLVTANHRWCEVNWLTLESVAVPGVHVLGDATMPGPAMPKSGHMANQQAKVAAAAIVRLLRGEPVDPDPVVMNTCYSFVTATEAVHVASVHRYDPADRNFHAVHGAGGLSAAASADEGRYALGWAQNIWHDTLAS